MSADHSPNSPEESAALSNGDVPQMPPMVRSDRVRLPFSFIQASDFRLDSPCHGVTGLPSEIRDRLLESRYDAAQRAFDSAIEHEVDFVVLPGGLLDAGFPGLQGPLFVAAQFRRLARHGIDVYWSSPSLETRSRWPAFLELPTNVHRLTADAVGILHGRSGHPVARLLTLPRDAGHGVAESDAFTIAVQPHCQDVPEIPARGVDFWALGGRPHSETVQVGDVIAHFAGSPQGRSLLETGSHSCSLVQVDHCGTVRIEPLLTDVVRWHHMRTTIDDATSWSDLESQLVEQQSRLRSDRGVHLHLVNWTVQGSGPAFERLLHPRLHGELINQLNRRRTDNEAAVWTMAIDPVIDSQQPALWRQLTTPLGEHTRALDDIAPGMDEMFGLSADTMHPLGILNEQARRRIIERAIQDGLYWLESEPESLRPAG